MLGSNSVLMALFKLTEMCSKRKIAKNLGTAIREC